MKKIWLHSVRSYIKLGLFFFFRRVYVHGVNSIPKDKPVLFLANHQNALLDALLIGTQSNRLLFFLTRAGVFNNKIISKLLSSFQMLPVYRIRDGWNNLSNNTAIFNTCAELFSKEEAIVIFPEGNHNLKRTVRPLSKGFTRIIFETFEKHPDTELLLIPVGLNYDKAEKFPSSISIFYGEAIAAKNFISNDRNQDVLSLKARVQSEISKLTTHIPSDDYNKVIKKLNDLNVDFLKPKNVNKTINSNFEFYESPKKNSNKILRTIFKTLLIISLMGPYIIWKYVAQPKITDLEFLSTFRFAVAITLVPIWILLLAVVLVSNFGWLVALGFIISILTLTLLTVKL